MSGHNAAGESVYKGPLLKQYQGWESLRGVAFMGDFEGVVSFGIAIHAKDKFRVSGAHNPNRLIIDIRHPA